VFVEFWQPKSRMTSLEWLLAKSYSPCTKPALKA
jgi:hypothetical protein